MRPSAPARPSRSRSARAGVAVAAAALALIAAGCGGGGAAASSSAPRAPSVFIDLLGSLPRSLDPLDEQGSEFEYVETSLAGTLVRPAGAAPAAGTLAPPDAVTGFLATSWRELADGDYVFELRRGVRSAYGHTLSGADVSFSFRRELAGSASARLLARLARISLRDPITVLARSRVRLNVTARSPLALAVLGDFRFGVLDSRAVLAHAAHGGAHAWLSTHLAFYGAYEQTGFVAGRRLLLAANPHFWAPLAFGHLAIEAAASTTLRVADIGAAAASHTFGLDWAGFKAARATSGVTAVAMASTTLSMLVPNERVRALASPLVRRALSLAIDRAAIARAAFAGFAEPARGPLPSSLALPAATAQPAPYAHDPALARALLSRAGYPHGFALALDASAAEGSGIAAELGVIASDLRAVGIAVRTRILPSSDALVSAMRSAGAGAALETSSTPIASAGYAIADAYLRGSPANIGDYQSPSADSLATALTGGGAQTGALARALAIVAETLPAIALVDVPAQLVTRAGIGGYAAYAAPATYYDRLRR